jgi:hypothetical protein
MFKIPPLLILALKSQRLTHVRKVSSGFEYFLLIFALRLGLTLKVVELDAELNSLSNGSIFNRSHRAIKGGEGEGKGVWVKSSRQNPRPFFVR